jgi:hypothetical protein
MKMRPTPWLSSLAGWLVFAGLLQGAEGWTKYNSQPGTSNKIKIEGTSTVHDWTVEGLIVGGFVEIGPNFPIDPAKTATPGKLDAKADIFIPVRALKSVKDGKPYSTAMDDIMYGKLLEPTNKRILFHLTELTLKEAAKGADAPHALEAKGDLVVAGVTNAITMPVKMSVLAGNKIKVSGGLSVKMTDFKIEPPAPSIALGVIKTGDEVKLSFDWVAAGPRKP